MYFYSVSGNPGELTSLLCLQYLKGWKQGVGLAGFLSGGCDEESPPNSFRLLAELSSLPERLRSLFLCCLGCPQFLEATCISWYMVTFIFKPSAMHLLTHRFSLTFLLPERENSLLLKNSTSKGLDSIYLENLLWWTQSQLISNLNDMYKILFAI